MNFSMALTTFFNERETKVLVYNDSLSKYGISFHSIEPDVFLLITLNCI